MLKLAEREGYDLGGKDWNLILKHVIRFYLLYYH